MMKTFGIVEKGCSLTIGNFDGVHKGHQFLLQTLKHEFGDPCVVVTFDPPPIFFLKKELLDYQLLTLETKVQYLLEQGIKGVAVISFDQALSQCSAQEFCELLYETFKPKGILVGYDFKFGHDRKGNFEFLKSLETQFGWIVKQAPAFNFDGEVISSSLVRKALHQGECDETLRLLGRPFRIEGLVQKGDQRGRLLGFPTANLHLLSQFLHPRKGVYEVQVHIPSLNKKGLRGVANFGIRPTFSLQEPQAIFEAHILNFHEDLYGQKIECELLKFIRPEKKFNSIEELKKKNLMN